MAPKSPKFFIIFSDSLFYIENFEVIPSTNYLVTCIMTDTQEGDRRVNNNDSVCVVATVHQQLVQQQCNITIVIV